MSTPGQLWTPPTNTTFTSLTPTNTTLATQAAGNNIAYAVASTASGDHLVGQYVAAPATPYCVIFSLALNPRDVVWNNTGGTCIFGGGFYDGTKAVTAHAVFNNGNAMGLDCYYWSTTTTISATLGGNREVNGSFATGAIQWFQLRNDGTNIYFYFATDANGNSPPTHWTLIYSEAVTSHLSAATNIGWFCDANANSSTNIYYFTLNSWKTFAL